MSWRRNRAQFLIPCHPFTDFETQKCYQNQAKLKDVYSRNDLPRKKDRAFLINLHKCKSIGIHWIVLYVNGDSIIYFDSFGVEHIPKETEEFMGNKNITLSIYRIQDTSQ